MAVFIARASLPVSAERAFAWHERPGAFERLAPPWRRVELVERTGGIADGGRVVLGLPVGPARVRWELVHKDFEPGRSFRDEQVRGPFRSWSHKHSVLPDAADGDRSRIEEHVTWELPLGGPTTALGAETTGEMLGQLFAYRLAVMKADLAAHERVRARGPLRIAVTGATGLVGSALVPMLTGGGHDVRRFVRGQDAGGLAEAVTWDPGRGVLDPAALDGVDAVVHLAGENVAGGRWTAERKERIRTSRVGPTRLLAETLARLERPPRVLVCASAIGIYDPRATTPLPEDGAQASGFLADVVRAWEAAADPARDKGIRVVHARIGTVLSPNGGALAKLLTPFRAGVGGPVGEGRQFMSWIALDDVVGALHHALFDEAMAGPVNLVAPEPPTNETFTRTLADVLGRPAFIRVPAAAIKLMFGEMGQALLLQGAPVKPQRLLDAGYAFRFPELRGAFEHVLGRRVDLPIRREGATALLDVG